MAVIDLDALEAGIAEGEARNFFVAPIVKEIIAELRELRSMRHADNEDIARAYDFARDKGQALERDAVVAWLRGEDEKWLDGEAPLLLLAREIERGEHRREGER